MIDDGEIRRAAAAWGVAASQIAHDHLLSHLLFSIRDVGGIVFFGGTALHRTFLDARLSEDVDLYFCDDPRNAATYSRPSEPARVASSPSS